MDVVFVWGTTITILTCVVVIRHTKPTRGDKAYAALLAAWTLLSAITQCWPEIWRLCF